MFTEQFGFCTCSSAAYLEPGMVIEMSDGSLSEVILIISTNQFVWRRLRWWHYPWMSLKHVIKFMLGLN